MLYFRFDPKTDELLEVREQAPDMNRSIHKPGRAARMAWKHHCDFNSFAMVNRIALQASKLTGHRHLPVDRGSHVSPRYDVIEAPLLGNLVSRGFNGDYYPAGSITKISASFRRIETSTGVVFWRVRNTESWRADQTWGMVSGHRSEQNPSF